MLKKPIASIVSAAFLVAGPGQMTVEAAVQTLSRGPVTNVSVAPVIVTGLNNPVPSASLFNMTALSLGALHVPSLMVAPSIVPAAAKPVPATPLLSAAAKAVPLSPAKDSPLAVIQSLDPTVGVTEKAAALNTLFEGGEGIEIADQPVAVDLGRYVWTLRKIENGYAFSGKNLPTISVVGQNAGVRAIMDGEPVKIDFTAGPNGGPPTALIMRREGETFTVDLEAEPPTVTGTIAGESLSVAAENGKTVIRHGSAGDFELNLSQQGVRLTSLTAEDVPEAVRRFAAYMLILRMMY